MRPGLASAVVCSLLVALLLAGGCGGDSEESGGTEIAVETGSLSKAEFTDQVNAICRNDRLRFERDFTAFAGSVSPSGDREAAAQKLVDTILVPIYSGQIDQIQAMGAPSGDEGEIEAYLVAMQEGLDAAVEEPLGFIGDKRHFIEAAELANEYGLTICARALV